MQTRYVIVLRSRTVPSTKLGFLAGMNEYCGDIIIASTKTSAKVFPTRYRARKARAGINKWTKMRAVVTRLKP